jgi:rod shape-determining protein MreD
MPLLQSSQKILLPAKLGFIVFTLLAGLLFNLLPWRDVRGVPDLLALVLLFWSIHQPRRIGIGVAWLFGLFMDTANGVLIGQYALGYAVLAFLGNALSRRILSFPIWPQTLHVLVIVLASQTLMVLVRMIAGGTFPGFSLFAGSLIAGALWPVASVLLLAPQRRASSVDEIRPI